MRLQYHCIAVTLAHFVDLFDRAVLSITHDETNRYHHMITGYHSNVHVYVVSVLPRSGPRL